MRRSYAVCRFLACEDNPERIPGSRRASRNRSSHALGGLGSAATSAPTILLYNEPMVIVVLLINITMMSIKGDKKLLTSSD